MVYVVVPMFSLCSHWLYSRGRGANLFRSYRPEVCRHTPRLKRVDILYIKCGTLCGLVHIRHRRFFLDT